MSTPTPTYNTGINNLTNFMNMSNSQVQLVIIGVIVVVMFIAIGYIFSRRKR